MGGVGFREKAEVSALVSGRNSSFLGLLIDLDGGETRRLVNTSYDCSKEFDGVDIPQWIRRV